MKPLCEKIKQLRISHGLTAVQLANMLGVKSKDIIYHWENGLAKPDYIKISKLCSIFHVSADYLIGTEYKKDDFSSEEIQHIKKYRNLNDHGKLLVDTILNLEYNQLVRNSNKAKNLLPMRFYRLPASAGTGNFLDSDVFDNIYIPCTPEAQMADYAIEVRGDSMEPQFHDGDKVLVKNQSTVEIGDIGIFIVNDDVYIKELGKNQLISLNKKYKPISLGSSDSVFCLGKVFSVL